MDQRLNLGSEVRELKLGSTFNSPKPRTSFHTLKYDFKPASVDISKTATLDVSSTHQVTVTMPHLNSSGVPKTVFKGSQRNYTKECVLIIDKVTGEITLEKLHHNIQVKKTRSETNSRPTTATAPGIASASASSGSSVPVAASMSSVSSNNTSGNSAIIRPLLENSTKRVSNKTRVSTGIRKNALGGIVQRHSPIQGSPSYPHHKSPQQAPVWHANNSQSTLPSIPMIGMDDDFLPSIATTSTANSITNLTHLEQSHQSSFHTLAQSSSSPSLNIGSDHHQPLNSNHNIGSNHNNLNNNSNSNNNNHNNNNRIQSHQSHLHHHSNEVGVLTSSDSSDSSDSDNDSGSDSDDDDDDDDDNENNENGANKINANSSIHQENFSHLNQQQHHQHSNNLSNRTGSLPALLLDEDLRLSESNSSDSDD